MFLDFIEIGTSDFLTEIEQATDETKGLSIEALQIYLDRLPDKKNIKKINVAVSDSTGFLDFFYITPENIIKYDFPSWVKGCNSVNKYHPTVLNIVLSKKLKPEEVFEKKIVQKTTLAKIMNEHIVNGVYYLKIDTEGHDTVILKQFINDNSNKFLLPHKIIFESNTLSNEENVREIITLYNKKGYDLIGYDHDTELRLNLRNIINKTEFSENIESYFLEDYPELYDHKKLPHDNNLESAKKYCEEHNFSGVTFQDNIYTVRTGKYLLPCPNHQNVTSWIYL